MIFKHKFWKCNVCGQKSSWSTVCSPYTICSPVTCISTHMACCQCVDFGCCTECNKNNESGVSEKLSYILWKSIFKTDASINETAPSNWCNWWRNSFENIDFQRRYDHSSETLAQLCLLQRVLWLCFICHVYRRLHTQSPKKKYKKIRFFIFFQGNFVICVSKWKIRAGWCLYLIWKCTTYRHQCILVFVCGCCLLL